VRGGGTRPGGRRRRSERDGQGKRARRLLGQHDDSDVSGRSRVGDLKNAPQCAVHCARYFDRFHIGQVLIGIRGQWLCQAGLQPKAIGTVDFGFDGFCPFRRDVIWLDVHEAAIAPLLDRLEFAAGVRNWGSRLRFGLLAISDHDLSVIAKAMRAEFPSQCAAVALA